MSEFLPADEVFRIVIERQYDEYKDEILRRVDAVFNKELKDAE